MKLALQVSYKGRCYNLTIAHPNGHVWYKVKVDSGEGAGIDELQHPSPPLPAYPLRTDYFLLLALHYCKSNFQLENTEHLLIKAALQANTDLNLHSFKIQPV